MSALAMLLLVGVFSVVGAQRCKSTTEFISGVHCCNKCHAGEYMVSPCTDNRSRTVCSGCPEGTFTALSNYAKTCLPCSRCSSALGQVTLQVCTATQDTVCGCPKGFYRKCLLLTDCSNFICEVCSSCPAEWEENTPCGDQMDTRCTPCPEGFFNNGSSPRCRPCTRCAAAEELSGCTRDSDVICRPVAISPSTRSTTVTPTKGSGDSPPWWAWLMLAVVPVAVGMLAVLARKSLAGRRLWCSPCREKILTLVPGCDDHRVDIIDEGLLDTPSTSPSVTSPSPQPQQQQPQQQQQQQQPPPSQQQQQRREPPALLNRAELFHAVLEAVPDGRFDELLRRRGLPEHAAAAARADHAGRRIDAKFAALCALGQARRWASPPGRPGALPGRALVELSATLAGPMGIPGVVDELWANVEALAWQEEEEEGELVC